MLSWHDISVANLQNQVCFHDLANTSKNDALLRVGKYANTKKGLSKFLHLPVDCQSLPPWPSPAELVNLKNI